MREQKNKLSRRTFLGGAAAFTAVAAVSPSVAFAETSAEKQAEADSVRIQVTNMQDTLATASDNYYQALDEHDQAVSAMEDAQQRIDDTNDQIDELQSKLSTRAKSMYRSGSTSFFDCLLGATSFEEFATNWDLLNTLNESDASMVQQCKDLRSQLEEEEAEYSRQEEIAAQKTEEAAQVKSEAENTVASLEATYSQLSAEAQTLLEEEQAAALEAQHQAEMAAAEASAQQQSADTGGTAVDTDGDGSVDYVDNSSNGTTTYDGYTVPSYSGTTSSYPTNGSVVDYALYCMNLGTPYVWGGETPGAGMDCSGLTKWCYAQIGISLGHYTESQYAQAKAVLPVSGAAAGDILYRNGHVGIAQVDGGTTYIHAPTFGAYVRNTDSLSWSGFTAALRF